MLKAFGSKLTLIFTATLVLFTGANAQGNAFTYQGRLVTGGTPASGNHDFLFQLYSNAAGTTQIGSDIFVNDQNVNSGLFTVTLDFGAGRFPGADRWLKIYVREDPASSNNDSTPGSFTPLIPLVKVNPTPYSIFAASAGSANSITLPVNLSVNAPGIPAFWITNTDTTSVNWGGVFYSDSPLGVGLLAAANSNTGTPYALIGRCDSPNGYSGAFSGGTFAVRTSAGTDKLRVSSTDGDLSFTDDQASITFPAADATNAPMIQMFASGVSNGDRMVIAHSPSFTDWGLQYRDSNDTFHFLQSGVSRMSIGINVGIGVESPGFKLDVSDRIRLRGGSGATSAGIWFFQTTTNNDRAFLGMYNDTTWGVWGNTGAGWQFFMDTSSGNFGMGATPVAGVKLLVDGTARVDVLEIVGADVAEKFQVSDGAIKPGMVVAIDPANPGKLCLAKGAYNRGVAGVVSGANDLPAGTVLGHFPGNENGLPVALTGRVWVYCDATDRAIEPTDLLTTSDRPGYAMAVKDYARANGAVLGKAMTRLEKGKTGLVLVLINLQ